MTTSGPSPRIQTFLALNPGTRAVAAATLLMTLGEELWKRYLPAYLRALGAPAWGVGLYGSARDLLDGMYQYPGGWVADRYGRQAALRGFVLGAMVGYAVLAIAPDWPTALIGVALAMAWTSMASPALFAVIGDALPPSRRAMGFSVQSIVRRLPIVVAPALGGLLIGRAGIVTGVQVGLAVSGALALATLFVIASTRALLPGAPGSHEALGVAAVWGALPNQLRRLLGSDVLIRTCEALVDVFVVVYVLEAVGLAAAEFGMLVAIQMIAAIVCYLPAARLADRVGRKPLVIATFLAFSLFPLSVVAARSFGALVLAFVIGGLREIGEPARKALIVDLARPDLRARSVGLYYLVRSVAITPAAFIGGLLWKIHPQLPFLVATGIGLTGTMVFAVTVEPETPEPPSGRAQPNDEGL